MALEEPLSVSKLIYFAFVWNCHTPMLQQKWSGKGNEIIYVIVSIYNL